MKKYLVMLVLVLVAGGVSAQLPWEKKQEKDDLSRSHKDVLCRVDTSAGGRLEYEVRQKDQPQKEQYIFERPCDGLIRICHSDRRTEQGLLSAGIVARLSSSVLRSLRPLVNQPPNKKRWNGHEQRQDADQHEFHTH